VNRTDLLLWLALEEDLGHGDVTTEATVDPELKSRAVVKSHEPFVLSGTYPFRRIFELLDPSVRVTSELADGEHVEAETPVFYVEGRVRTLLTGERTALNLLQRLCGIATATRRMAEALAGAPCKLLDTRKTVPLWRCFEKDAVRHGGGHNHRFNLADGVLIKDNHVQVAGGVGEAVRRAKARVPHTLKVEVEVETLEELEEALEAGADVVLLDNFSLELLGRAVRANRGRALLEASGGINVDTVRAVAETGVDLVSCGALTHSARAVDLHMEMAPPWDDTV
jgi:nicotinate-nucleotide pyrophosphorylase (carboxylating)